MNTSLQQCTHRKTCEIMHRPSIKIALQSVVAVGHIGMCALYAVLCTMSSKSLKRAKSDWAILLNSKVFGWILQRTAAAALCHSLILVDSNFSFNFFIDLSPHHQLMTSYGNFQTALISSFHSKNLMEQFLRKVSVAMAFEFCRQTETSKKDRKRGAHIFFACMPCLFSFCKYLKYCPCKKKDADTKTQIN